jgi:O6-methylguanine-DNA--protein-cysteine methyltransferase
VVGSAGSLGGFTGGIGLKKKLLELEIRKGLTQRTRKRE